MATASFTSTAVCTSSAAATLSVPSAAQGYATLTRHGFQVRTLPAGVYITKAPTFGGTQVALPTPLSKSDARELAEALLQVTG